MSLIFRFFGVVWQRLTSSEGKLNMPWRCKGGSRGNALLYLTSALDGDWWFLYKHHLKVHTNLLVINISFGSCVSVPVQVSTCGPATCLWFSIIPILNRTSPLNWILHAIFKRCPKFFRFYLGLF